MVHSRTENQKVPDHATLFVIQLRLPKSATAAAITRAKAR
jgi:hypothetical protein